MTKGLSVSDTDRNMNARVRFSCTNGNGLIGVDEVRCLPSGVNFINVLHTAFMLADPKSVKKIDNLTVFFTLLGSTSAKAVRRTLMKLIPGGQRNV